MGRVEADIALKIVCSDFSPVREVIVWLASHVLPYLSLWVGCRL